MLGMAGKWLASLRDAVALGHVTRGVASLNPSLLTLLGSCHRRFTVARPIPARRGRKVSRREEETEARKSLITAVRRKRLAEGLSRARLAKRLGVYWWTVKSWENMPVAPSDENYKKLLAYLDASTAAPK